MGRPAEAYRLRLTRAGLPAGRVPSRHCRPMNGGNPAPRYLNDQTPTTHPTEEQTQMVTLLKHTGDALWKRADDPGYRIGWRSKAKFEKGHLDGEMSYGEAEAKARELSASEPDKTYFPELILTEEEGEH